MMMKRKIYEFQCTQQKNINVKIEFNLEFVVFFNTLHT